MVDPEGRNQIAVAPGANHRVSVEMVAARPDDLAWPQVVLCPLELPPPTVAWVLREAKSRGALTIFNPAPVQPLPDEVWADVDYLTPNEGEAARLTGGVADPGTAASALLARGVRTVVVTLGAQGVLACGSGPSFRVAAPAVTAIDTTGAGDAFNGALAVALGEGRPLPTRCASPPPPGPSPAHDAAPRTRSPPAPMWRRSSSPRSPPRVRLAPEHPLEEHPGNPGCSERWGAWRARARPPIVSQFETRKSAG